MATNDERAIRELVDTLAARATEVNDLDTVLGLMAGDVLFLTPGGEAGKDAFEKAARERDATIESVIEIEELEVTKDRAWMRNRLSVTTSRSPFVRIVRKRLPTRDAW